MSSKRVVASAAAVAAALAAGCGGEDAPERARPAPATTADSAAAVAFAAEGWKTDFSRKAVPLDEIRSGGPPRDGIPAIDRPRFAPVSAADAWLHPREPVIELVVGESVRAYPLQILTWHEIVNDELAGRPVAVTFCPLCNIALVFDRRVGGRVLDFGTTGKLRHSDLVMYDRQTESWWQQFGGEGIVGAYAGTRLDLLPSRIVAWEELRRRHPTARVLSRETGFDRPYGRNPYEGYDDVDSPPLFDAANLDDDRLPPKERVVYLERDGDAVVVPYSTLARRKVVHVDVGGHRLVVRWRSGVSSPLDTGEIASGRDVGAAEVLENGRHVAFAEPFWFAVAAFSEDARIVR